MSWCMLLLQTARSFVARGISNTHKHSHRMHGKRATTDKQHGHVCVRTWGDEQARTRARKTSTTAPRAVLPTPLSAYAPHADCPVLTWRTLVQMPGTDMQNCGTGIQKRSTDAASAGTDACAPGSSVLSSFYEPPSPPPPAAK
eukprot:1278490-Rhodomonas_salina.1